MLASFIIPNHNRVNETLRLTNMIRPPENANYEVIVIEYNTPEIVEYGDRIRVISMTDAPYDSKANGLNMAHARNIGILHATGEWLVFLDCDIVPSNIAMRRLFEYLPGLEKNIIYGGLRIKRSSSGSIIAYDPTDFSQPDPSVYGFCMIIHNEQVKRLNGWNEGMSGWSGEDVELVNRARQMGMKTKILQDVQWRHDWHSEASWKGNPNPHLIAPGGYRVMQETKFEADRDKYMEEIKRLRVFETTVTECEQRIKAAKQAADQKISEAEATITRAKLAQEETVQKLNDAIANARTREAEWDEEREALRELIDDTQKQLNAALEDIEKVEGEAIGWKDEAEHLRADLLLAQAEKPRRRWWLLWLA